MSGEDDVLDGLDGERGHSSVSGRKREASTKQKVLGVLAMVLVGGGILWLTWPAPKEKKDKERQSVVRQTNQFEPAPIVIPPEVRVQPASLPRPLPTPAQIEQKEEEDKMLTSARRAPVLLNFRGGGAQGRGGAPAAAPPVGVPAPGAQEEKNELESKLKPTTLEGFRAGVLPNRDFIIAQGVSIPCVLETAMSSDQPGFVSCVVTRDILSDNGRVVLLDKGTQVVGEYRGGLKRGQRRLFVLWTRAKTPKGVIIPLASPGTDALGRAGFDGDVDTHWWERFGSSLVLSLVDDVTKFGMDRLGAVSQKGGNNSNQVYFEPRATSESGKDAAAIAVQESVNIPPTLEKNQGELVNIFVARDLDFSSVYALKVTEPRTRILDRAATGNFERPVHPTQK
jgi:type IV secretion system protein VirB10